VDERVIYAGINVRWHTRGIAFKPNALRHIFVSILGSGFQRCVAPGKLSRKVPPLSARGFLLQITAALASTFPKQDVKKGPAHHCNGALESGSESASASA
jgi:hypothetical protein